MTEPELDTAIDRAVRDLMNVDADSAFRTRVTARLERPASRRMRLPWLAIPATAAAIVVVLIWVRSTPGGPAGPAPLARVETPAASAPPPAARGRLPPSSMTPSAGSLPRQLFRRAATIPIARGVVVAAVAEEPVAESATAIAPPLTPLESIEVEPIAHAQVAAVEIVVMPLSPITELQVSPLEPRAARD